MENKRNKIDLSERFKAEICTFEAAKKAKKFGMTSANTFLSYDEDGQICDGAWLEDVAGMKMYPAINFPLVIMMLGETDLETGQTECYELNGKYFIKYKDEIYEAKNLVDVLIDVWTIHKK